MFLGLPVLAALSFVTPTWGLIALIVVTSTFFHLARRMALPLPIGYIEPIEAVVAAVLLRILVDRPSRDAVIPLPGGERLLLSAILPYAVWQLLCSTRGIIVWFGTEHARFALRFLLTGIVPLAIPFLLLRTEHSGARVFRAAFWVALAAAFAHLCIQMLDYRPIMQAAYVYTTDFAEYRFVARNQLHAIRTAGFTRLLPQGIVLISLFAIWAAVRYMITTRAADPRSPSGHTPKTDPSVVSERAASTDGYCVSGQASSRANYSALKSFVSGQGFSRADQGRQEERGFSPCAASIDASRVSGQASSRADYSALKSFVSGHGFSRADQARQKERGFSPCAASIDASRVSGQASSRADYSALKSFVSGHGFSRADQGRQKERGFSPCAASIDASRVSGQASSRADYSALKSFVSGHGFSRADQGVPKEEDFSACAASIDASRVSGQASSRADYSALKSFVSGHGFSRADQGVPKEEDFSACAASIDASRVSGQASSRADYSALKSFVSGHGFSRADQARQKERGFSPCLAACILSAALFTTVTRSILFTVLAGIAVGLMFALQSRRPRALPRALLSLALLAAAASGYNYARPGFLDYWMQRLDLLSGTDSQIFSQENEARGRDNLASLNVIADNPLFGIGSFRYPADYSLRRLPPTDIHPLLQIGLVGGVPAILLLLRMHVLLILEPVRRMRRNPELAGRLIPLVAVLTAGSLIANIIGAGGAIMSAPLLALMLFVAETMRVSYSGDAPLGASSASPASPRKACPTCA